jgi:hypothetical protein
MRRTGSVSLGRHWRRLFDSNFRARSAATGEQPAQAERRTQLDACHQRAPSCSPEIVAGQSYVPSRTMPTTQWPCSWSTAVHQPRGVALRSSSRADRRRPAAGDPTQLPTDRPARWRQWFAQGRPAANRGVDGPGCRRRRWWPSVPGRYGPGIRVLAYTGPP